MNTIRLRKRSFLLVEALVAIALLFATGFAFFEIQSSISKKSLQTIRAVEAEIAYQHALAELIEGLYNKQFADDAARGFRATVRLQALDKWKVTYAFNRRDPPEDPPDPQETLILIKVSIAILTHDEWGDFPIIDPDTSFTFCVKK